MSTPDARPALRLVSPDSDDPPPSTSSVVATFGGWALEMTIWDRKPPDADAVFHDSGCWVALRVGGPVSLLASGVPELGAP